VQTIRTNIEHLVVGFPFHVDN